MPEHTGMTAAVDPLLATPFALALLVYAGGVVRQLRRGRRWPWYRAAAWTGGVATAAAGFTGPLATAAHTDVVAHMVAHVLVGMVAPVLLVLAVPITLALRCLRVDHGRTLSRLLSSPPIRFVSHPVVAALLAVGGMWALYRTPLFPAMQQSMVVHLLVMVHFLLAGWLFTAAIIPVDPTPHRSGYRMRAVVLFLALAAHGVLAKSLYAYPPAGTDIGLARSAAMLMFYAGDVVDAVIILLLCARWYRDAGRRLGEPGDTLRPRRTGLDGFRARV